MLVVANVSKNAWSPSYSDNLLQVIFWNFFSIKKVDILDQLQSSLSKHIGLAGVDLTP